MLDIKDSPIWLTVHSHPIKQTGQLNLKNNIQINLYDFSLDSFASFIPLIKILDISGNYSIESLEGLPYFPHLHVFNANDTGLLTFKNFSSIRHATKVSFKNTPISKFITYRLAILLIFGKKLVSIDGQIISNNLYQKSTQYPKVIIELINRGWIVEYPCPKGERLRLLCDLFNIDNFEDDSSESSSVSQSSCKFISIDSFQNIVKEYHLKQKQMFEESEPLFAPSVIIKNEQRNIAKELAISIKNIFYERGRLININDLQETLRAVEDICAKASLKRKISESLAKRNCL